MIDIKMKNVRSIASILFVTTLFSCNSVCVASIRGELVNPGEFTYVVALTNNDGYCTGSILNERFILTAAHCVIDDNNEFIKGQLKVIAGVQDISSTSRIEVNVKKITIPWAFDGTIFPLTGRPSPGDIAILKLEKPLDIQGNSLQTVKLLENLENYTDQVLQFAGFGVARIDVWLRENGAVDYKRSAHGKLRKVEMRETEFCPAFNEETFCASLYSNPKYEWKGPCDADSGGSLVSKDQIVVGILTFTTNECDDRILPEVFTSVDYHKHFINDAMKDSKYYRSVKANQEGYF